MLEQQRAKADSTRRCSQTVPDPSTNRALSRLTSEVKRDPVHSTRYGRQRIRCRDLDIYAQTNCPKCTCTKISIYKHANANQHKFMCKNCVHGDSLAQPRAKVLTSYRATVWGYRATLSDIGKSTQKLRTTVWGYRTTLSYIGKSTQKLSYDCLRLSYDSFIHREKYSKAIVRLSEAIVRLFHT